MSNDNQLELFSPQPTHHVMHTFGWAVEQMKVGRRVCRLLWRNDGIFVSIASQQLTTPTGLAPFFIISYNPSMHAVWHPTINDILAEDYDYA